MTPTSPLRVVLNATGELDTLGLLPSVMAGLANATYTNDGGYGPPTSSATSSTPPLSWWPADWNWVWSSVSGVATDAISMVWNAAVAAATFVADLGKAAARASLTLESQAAIAISAVGSAVVSALMELLAWIASEIIGLLKAGMTAASHGITSSLGGLESDENNAASGLAWSYAQGRAAQGNETAALQEFLLPLLFGGGIIGVAVSVALALLAPFTLGLGFLFPLLVPVIMDAFGLDQKLGLPSIGQQSQADRGAYQASGTSVQALSSGDEAMFNSFESPSSSGQIQPPSAGTQGDRFGYGDSAAATVGSALFAILAGCAAGDGWGAAAGWAGFVLLMTALVFLLPISIQQTQSPPSSYSVSDAAEFRQVQITDIELSFFAFAGIVLSAAES